MLSALIVDDEADIGLMVSMFLKKAEVETKYCETIGSARSEIEERSYDVFFLDLNLPDGTGFDLVPQIRAKNPNARIIIISAYDGLVEQKRAEEFKVNAFIRKPFSKLQILQSIELG